MGQGNDLPAQTGLNLSAALFLGPSAFARAAAQIPQASAGRPNTDFAPRTRRTDHSRYASRPLSGPNAQDHLASGAARRLNVKHSKRARCSFRGGYGWQHEIWECKPLGYGVAASAGFSRWSVESALEFRTSEAFAVYWPHPASSRDSIPTPVSRPFGIAIAVTVPLCRPSASACAGLAVGRIFPHGLPSRRCKIRVCSPRGG